MKLLIFKASYCEPSKRQSQEFKEHPINVEVEEVDIDKDYNNLVTEHNIKSTPTMVLLDGEGNTIEWWLGFTKSEVINERIDVFINT